MKDTKRLVSLLITIIFLSIAAGGVAGFFVYRDYKENTAHLGRRVQSTMDKFGMLEDNLKDIYVTLENTMDESAIERKQVLDKIEAMKEGLRNWETEYRDAMLQLKADMDNLKVEKLTRTVENLRSDIRGFKMKMQDMELRMDDTKGVDLGRISVNSEERER